MEKQKKCILVVNPISGDLDKTEITDAVKAYAKKHKITLLTYETTGQADEKAIYDLYESEKPDRILVAGGDGTVKMVAEALQHQDVIIGILPAGSANGLSVDLNLPLTVKDTLATAFGENVMALDMISINGKKSLHLSDLGLNAELVRNYENSSKRGMLGYALQAITTLKDSQEPFQAQVTANGQTVQCVARMIVIANSQKYGTGVTINPSGKMDDGKFEIVILKNLDLIVFGKIITGNMPVGSEDVEIITTDKALIKTNHPVCFQIDGEYCGEETDLDIHILPGQMKVAIPAAEMA